MLPLKLKGIANDIADPGAHELAYGKVPTKAAASVLKNQAAVMAGLAKVTCPALIFGSLVDHAVHPSNAPYAYEHLGSSDKELVRLERSYHVATLDYDKELIFERTNTFIKEHTD
jgi:carboxylesterase